MNAELIGTFEFLAQKGFDLFGVEVGGGQTFRNIGLDDFAFAIDFEIGSVFANADFGVEVLKFNGFGCDGIDRILTDIHLVF